MTTVSNPNTTVSILSANAAVENAAQKIIVVAQQTASNVTAGTLVENVQDNAADDLFGANSMAASIINRFYLTNKVNQIDCIPLDDNVASTKSAGVIDFTGSVATENGELEIIIGSTYDFRIKLVVTTGDDASTIGNNLVAAIGALPNIPVTAINTTGSVALEAVHGGTLGDDIGLSVSKNIAGVTYALTGMTGGAGDPDTTGVLDVVGDNRYQAVIWPYWKDTENIRVGLEFRWNIPNKILDGIAFTSSVDTFTNHINRLTPLNSQVLVDFCDELIDDAFFKGPAMLELPYNKVAEFVAIRSLRLTDKQPISDFVSAATAERDGFGGAGSASLPYFNTPMDQLPLIAAGRGFTQSEIDQLAAAGGSVIGNNAANNTALTGAVVTTYKTDDIGNNDISYKFLNYVDTATGAREYFFNNLKANYAQSRLTDGDLEQGRTMANEASIRAFVESLYLDLSGPDFVLLRSGVQNIAYFKETLGVIIDLADGSVQISMQAPIVTQLRNIVATMQITFIQLEG